MQQIIEEYKPKEDEELKELLALIDIMNKMIDEVVLKICNDFAEELLNQKRGVLCKKPL